MTADMHMRGDTIVVVRQDVERRSVEFDGQHFEVVDVVTRWEAEDLFTKLKRKRVVEWDATL